MKRSEFIFLLGFDGHRALIDKYLVRKYGRKTTVELAELGFYKAAFCSALFNNSEKEQEELLRWFRDHNLFTTYDFSGLKKLFGISEVPLNVTSRSV